eukprot:CAMPEP_0172782416 /NCGR_PEP_ID=MMETSP1074-20121228/203923_1 /TAXON_ID=2916 /ORGANISM="Ceratium fusus, Strain PA161109" /LENGTH=35 /DNA_ID= /DNA_START= /DNA_END= /DNA_ORIENTATION=
MTHNRHGNISFSGAAKAYHVWGLYGKLYQTSQDPM